MEAFEVIVDLIIKVETKKRNEQSKVHTDNLDAIISQSKQSAYSDVLIDLYNFKLEIQQNG